MKSGWDILVGWYVVPSRDDVRPPVDNSVVHCQVWQTIRRSTTVGAILPPSSDGPRRCTVPIIQVIDTDHRIRWRRRLLVKEVQSSNGNGKRINKGINYQREESRRESNIKFFLPALYWCKSGHNPILRRNSSTLHQFELGIRIL